MLSNIYYLKLYSKSISSFYIYINMEREMTRLTQYLKKKKKKDYWFECWNSEQNV